MEVLWPAQWLMAVFGVDEVYNVGADGGPHDVGDGESSGGVGGRVGGRVGVQGNVPAIERKSGDLKLGWWRQLGEEGKGKKEGKRGK